jgi:hypothetical protein
VHILKRDLPLKRAIIEFSKVLPLAAALRLLLATDGQNAVGNFNLDILLRYVGQFRCDDQLRVPIFQLNLWPAKAYFRLLLPMPRKMSSNERFISRFNVRKES